MIASGMADAGYPYVNVDDCWIVKPGSPGSPGSIEPLPGRQALDARNAVLPNCTFPDLQGPVDSIHALGLQAAIYSSPGELTCAWRRQDPGELNGECRTRASARTTSVSSGSRRSTKAPGRGLADGSSRR